MSLENLEAKLETAKQELADLKLAYKRALNGQSYDMRDGDSQRSVVNQNLSVLSKEISKKEAEISYLENQIANNGRSGRAFRVGQIW